MAPQMFSAPGTIRVQCPWHFQCSGPLALSQSSLCSFLLQFKWILVPPLSLGFQSILGWNWNFPLCCGVSFGLHVPPRNGVDCGKTGQCPPHDNWAESSSTDCHSTIGVCNGVMHCLMSACWPHCKCHMFASFLLWKEIIFCITSTVSCQPAS